MSKTNVFKVLIIFGLSCLFVCNLSANSFVPLAQALTYDQIVSGQTRGQVLGASTPAQIEAVSAVSNGTGIITTTFATPTTAGELVVVDLYLGANGNIPTSVTDNKSDTYTPVWSIPNVGTHLYFGLYYLANAPAGISSVTITENGDNDGGAVVSHYTGIAASNPVDVYSAPGTTGSASPWASSAVTTTQANDLLIGTADSFEQSGNCSYSASGNWAQDVDITSPPNYGLDGANGNAMAFAHQIVSSIQTNIQNTGTNPTGTCNNYAGIAAFKAGTAGPPDTTPPSTPTNLSATAVSSSAINLSWTASTDNVGVTGYTIYRGGAQVGISATNSYSDTGLTASTQYTYTVSAYDAAGNNSPQSSSAQATTQAQSTDTTLHANASSTGADILFTASDGLTKLNYERESYNSSTGQLIAWVQIPSLSSVSDTVIYLDYGNLSAGDQQQASGVWDSSYVGVWHLPNGSTLSAINSITGTAGTLASPTAVAGKIDGGASFNGSSDKITTDITANSSSRTYSIWAYRTGSGGGTLGRMFDKRTASAQVELLYNSINGYEFDRDFNSGGSEGDWYVAAPSLNAWHYVVVTYNSGSASNVPTFYIDGALANVTALTTPSGTADTNSDPYVIGNRGNDNARGWAGNLDEFRISNTIRSADWIATEYNNQNSPATFFTNGPAQSAPPSHVLVRGGDTGGKTSVKFR